MHAYIAEPLAPPGTPAPPAARKKRSKLETALVVIAAILALTLIGTAVKMWTDRSTINDLNASISTLKGEKADLEGDVSGLETNLSASESVNDNLQGQVDQAQTTIAKYLVCTRGLLRSSTQMANGGLFGSYSALNSLKAVKDDCVYAFNHSDLAKSEFA